MPKTERIKSDPQKKSKINEISTKPFGSNKPNEISAREKGNKIWENINFFILLKIYSYY